MNRQRFALGQQGQRGGPPQIARFDSLNSIFRTGTAGHPPSPCPRGYTSCGAPKSPANTATAPLSLLSLMFVALTAGRDAPLEIVAPERPSLRQSQFSFCRPLIALKIFFRISSLFYSRFSIYIYVLTSNFQRDFHEMSPL